MIEPIKEPIKEPTKEQFGGDELVKCLWVLLTKMGGRMTIDKEVLASVKGKFKVEDLIGMYRITCHRDTEDIIDLSPLNRGLLKQAPDFRFNRGRFKKSK